MKSLLAWRCTVICCFYRRTMNFVLVLHRLAQTINYASYPVKGLRLKVVISWMIWIKCAPCKMTACLSTSHREDLDGITVHRINWPCSIDKITSAMHSFPNSITAWQLSADPTTSRGGSCRQGCCKLTGLSKHIHVIANDVRNGLEPRIRLGLFRLGPPSPPNHTQTPRHRRWIFVREMGCYRK